MRNIDTKNNSWHREYSLFQDRLQSLLTEANEVRQRAGSHWELEMVSYQNPNSRLARIFIMAVNSKESTADQSRLVSAFTVDTESWQTVSASKKGELLVRKDLTAKAFKRVLDHVNPGAQTTSPEIR